MPDACTMSFLPGLRSVHDLSVFTGLVLMMVAVVVVAAVVAVSVR